MNGTERRLIAEALEPFGRSLNLETAECGCDCDCDCEFLAGDVAFEAADVERLENALRAVGYEIKEIQR